MEWGFAIQPKEESEEMAVLVYKEVSLYNSTYIEALKMTHGIDSKANAHQKWWLNNDWNSIQSKKNFQIKIFNLTTGIESKEVIVVIPKKDVFQVSLGTSSK